MDARSGGATVAVVPDGMEMAGLSEVAVGSKAGRGKDG
jgi:hypothetical protein